ncbi:hypothetical protein B0T20DRAFT_72240 [Sordaria brevicollis]|uniref:Uncharacterized protein n=1 Tax=Sordaria brevicollis TaxID=83679 RepID=A0AAE0P310_SORBR|nr:hypothetical protein B0T20DRAFT_72240 [Sordaria brevicollis]
MIRMCVVRSLSIPEDLIPNIRVPLVFSSPLVILSLLQSPGHISPNLATVSLWLDKDNSVKEPHSCEVFKKDSSSQGHYGHALGRYFCTMTQNPQQDTRQAGSSSTYLDHGVLVFCLSLKSSLSVGPIAASLAFPAPFQDRALLFVFLSGGREGPSHHEAICYRANHSAFSSHPVSSSSIRSQIRRIKTRQPFFSSTGVAQLGSLTRSFLFEQTMYIVLSFTNHRRSFSIRPFLA